MANPYLSFAKEAIPVVGSLFSEGIKQYREHGAAQKQANQERWGTRLGQPSAEDELLAARNQMNRIAPERRTRIEQQPTMTPFQNLMSNAALFGAIPGGIQQAVPGLLPAIGRTGEFGKGVQKLFGPDTSYVDEAADQATRNFQERVVPGIMAQYGEGQDQAREYALRQAATEFQRELAGMRMGAHEKGLARMDTNTQNLLNIGMKNRFENIERPVEEEDQFAKATGAVKADAITEFGETRGGHVGKAFDKANDKQKLAMKNVLQGVAGKDKKDPRKQLAGSLKTPEEFEAYDALVNSVDPQIKGLVDAIIGKKLSSTSKSDLMNIYKAVKHQNQRAIDRIAERRGLQKKQFQIDWKLVKGIAAPLAVMAAAPLGATAVASGAIPIIKDFMSSIFSKSKKTGITNQGGNLNANAQASVGG